MSFIKKWFRKEPEDIDHNDLQKFIDTQMEENINLDYKNIQMYPKFSELSKDVCAFSNSYGGLIILGVSEKKIGRNKIFPDEITWGISDYTKEQLENNLTSKIQPLIDRLFIQPIRNKNGSGEVIFLIDIPNSVKKPHMSNFRFYKRLNFQSIPIDYNEVKSMFLENQIYKEKWIENVIGPLYNDVIYIMNNMKYDFFYRSEVFDNINERFRYLFHQMNELNLLEYMDYFYTKLSTREKYLDQLKTYTDNLIKQILLTRFYHSDGIIISTDDPYLSIQAIQRYDNLNEGQSSASIYKALLIQLDPIEEMKKRSGIIEVKDIKYYIKNRSGEEYDLSKDEFDDLWKDIKKEIRSNERFKYIWKSTDEISTLCEEAYDYLTEKF